MFKEAVERKSKAMAERERLINHQAKLAKALEKTEKSLAKAYLECEEAQVNMDKVIKEQGGKEHETFKPLVVPEGVQAPP